MKTTLTARQQQVLDLLESVIAETGAPPTRAEIARALGFKSANAAEEHLQALARKGAITLLSGTSRGIRLKTTQRPEPPESWQLPLIGRVAAGAPVLAQEHVEQSYAVAPGLFSQKPDYLLRVKGMSMRDIGIMDGDLLAVRSTSEARNGQIVVARIGEEVTVKRFERKADCIELHPENPDFRPIIVRADQPFAIEGLAVGLIRKDF